MATKPFTVDLRMKRMFFDRQKVLNRIGREKAKMLNRGGTFVRRGARKLLGRPSKNNKPRPAGKPPRVHTADEHATLRNILYYYDGKDSVIIGPVKLNQVNQSAVTRGNITVPELHERGGTVTIHEVSYDRGKTWLRRNGRRNAKPWHQYRRRKASYPARPFMGPTLAKVAPKLPYLFARNSIGEAA